MAAKKSFFEKFSNAATSFTGSSYAFIAACLIVLTWAASGPFFNFSETWQLIINTGTTIVTFMMVFLIQKAQNKDSKAIQIKLNELIVAQKAANNQLIDIENLTEAELDEIHVHYERLAEIAGNHKALENLNGENSIDSSMTENNQKAKEL